MHKLELQWLRLIDQLLVEPQSIEKLLSRMHQYKFYVNKKVVQRYRTIQSQFIRYR
jgi:hypothetical protein